MTKTKPLSVMIQANQLRVNNYVKRNDIDGVFTIRGVCKDRIHPIELIDHDNVKNAHWACQCTLSELEPIPLTPEILIACGFVKTVFKEPLIDYTDYRLENMVCNPIGSGEIEIEYCKLDIEERTYIASFKYLHQLQNAFYILTSKELNYQP